MVFWFHSFASFPNNSLSFVYSHVSSVIRAFPTFPSLLFNLFLFCADQATAEYLFKVMPAQWLAERRIDSPTKIYSTLQKRTADNSLCYEDRVAQALMALGPPPAT
jgi:hypothetical protein